MLESAGIRGNSQHFNRTIVELDGVRIGFALGTMAKTDVIRRTLWVHGIQKLSTVAWTVSELYHHDVTMLYAICYLLPTIYHYINFNIITVSTITSFDITIAIA